MNKLRLYKNNNIVFEKDATIKDNKVLAENITYYINESILVREDDNFKYELNFKDNNALVLIKEKNYSLNLLLETKEITHNDQTITIIYKIESDIENVNKIEIIL